MTRLKRMLQAHPHPAAANGEQARKCIEACAECAQACTVCADACLAEARVADLVNCVRLNLDCADVCHITGTLVTRPSHRDAPALRAQLEACHEICHACADECNRHSDMEHCRICAEVCNDCAAACEEMMVALVP